ncbi:MAG: hypothetical protein ACYCU7_19060, partial [Acidimicrobiales bacterium]
MKKYFIIISALMTFALSNAMEQRYQNPGEEGQSTPYEQPTRHYTLDDLRQGSTAPATETQGHVQSSNNNFDDYLALFGLQEGYTVNQLLDRYNLYACTTAEEANRMYQAFYTLYPYARRDQQPSHAMEIDSSDNNLDTIENAHAIGNNLLGEVESHHPYEMASEYDQWIEQLCHEIEQAIQLGVQDDRILRNITTYLFGHENYTAVPRNEWFDLPPYSTFRA